MTPLVEKTREYVESSLINRLPSNCIYHNLTHTKRVVKSTKEIIDNTVLSDEDKEILLLSAWMHDIGHIEGCVNHEEKSVEWAREFLQKEGATTSIIEGVTKCIRATRMDLVPAEKNEKIIRDADASHFAKDYFEEASEFLRLELELQDIAHYSKLEWLEGNINLLKDKHVYYSEYAKEYWTPKKEENIKIMKKELKDIKKDEKSEVNELKKELKSKDPEKAIQSVYRITLRNHIKLSDIADTKANILLSVNAIIISIALSNLIPKLDNPSNQYLLYPTLVFLVFTVASIILSIIATRPNITSGKFTREDVEKKNVNLLFFGNFHKMNLSEFQWAMNEMINDKEYIYSSLTKDLYFLGVVLQRKYRILRLTYTIFMIGIIVSVIAFAISVSLLGTS